MSRKKREFEETDVTNTTTYQQYLDEIKKIESELFIWDGLPE